MAERIRFHLDEHMDPDIARALSAHGIDVTTTQGSGLREHDDDAQLRYIQRTRRVMVTDDADFLRMAARSTDHPGIAYCDRTAMTIGDIIRGLILVYEVLTDEDMRGGIEWIASL